MKKLAILAAVGVALATPAFAQHNGSIVSLDNSLARYDRAMDNADAFEARRDSAAELAGLYHSAYSANPNTPISNGIWNLYQNEVDTVRRAHNDMNLARNNANSLLTDTINQGTGTKSTGQALGMAHATRSLAYTHIDSQYGSFVNRNPILTDAVNAIDQGWTGEGIDISVVNGRGVRFNENIIKAIAPGAGVYASADSYNGGNIAFAASTTFLGLDSETRAYVSVEVPNGAVASLDNFNNSLVGIVVKNNVSPSDLADNEILIRNRTNTGGLHVGYTPYQIGNEALNVQMVSAATALVMDKFEGTSGATIVDVMYATADNDGRINLNRAMSPHGVLR